VYEGTRLVLRKAESASLRRFLGLALKQKRECDRAFFVRVGYELAGPAWRTLQPALVAVEMLDAATIVLDDIMDRSEWRGDRPALYRTFGLAASLSGALVLHN